MIAQSLAERGIEVPNLSSDSSSDEEGNDTLVRPIPIEKQADDTESCASFDLENDDELEHPSKLVEIDLEKYRKRTGLKSSELAQTLDTKKGK